MHAAGTPTAEISDPISHHAEFELIMAGGRGRIDRQERRRRWIRNIIDADAVAGAVSQPDSQTGDVVFRPDVTIGNRWTGVRFALADEANVDVLSSEINRRQNQEKDQGLKDEENRVHTLTIHAYTVSEWRTNNFPVGVLIQARHRVIGQPQVRPVLIPV